MSDFLDDFFPDLSTEEGRDECIERILTTADPDDPEDWCRAVAVSEEIDGTQRMIILLRYSDGREEVFDCDVLRSMEVERHRDDPEQASTSIERVSN